MLSIWIKFRVNISEDFRVIKRTRFPYLNFKGAKFRLNVDRVLVLVSAHCLMGFNRQTDGQTDGRMDI